MNWTLAHIEKLYAQGRIRGYKIMSTKSTPKTLKGQPKKKHSKYSAVKTEVDGIVFDSAKEARRYKELLLLRKAGYIGFLEMQVPFELNAGGTHSLKYIADFVYRDTTTGKRVVEDVKGFRTAVYRKKKRLMKKLYGIEINEV